MLDLHVNRRRPKYCPESFTRMLPPPPETCCMPPNHHPCSRCRRCGAICPLVPEFEQDRWRSHLARESNRRARFPTEAGRVDSAEKALSCPATHAVARVFWKLGIVGAVRPIPAIYVLACNGDPRTTATVIELSSTVVEVPAVLFRS